MSKRIGKKGRKWEKCTKRPPTVPMGSKKYIPCDSPREHQLVRYVKLGLHKRRSRPEQMRLCEVQIFVNPHGKVFFFLFTFLSIGVKMVQVWKFILSLIQTS